MEDEQLDQPGRVNLVDRRNENGLLGHPVDNHQDSGMSVARRKVFNAVHGDGVSRLLGDRKLLECSVGLVPRCLRPLTSRARLAIVLDDVPNTGPGVVSVDELQSLVHSVITGKDVVVLVTEDAKSEVGTVGNVDPIVEKK